MKLTTILAIVSLILATAFSHADSFFWQAQTNPNTNNDINVAAMQYQPNPQQLWLIQRLMAQQQQQQQQSSSPNVGSSTNRIAELIFGPSKQPKSYAEKLETLSRRIAKSDGLSHDDTKRIRNLNRDLVGRLFDRKEPDYQHHHHQQQHQLYRRRNETMRLVGLIRRIVDERLEFYLNKLNEATSPNEYDEYDETSHNSDDEEQRGGGGSGGGVYISQVETRRKEARPRKYLRYVDADESVDGYYAEKIHNDSAQNLAHSATSRTAGDDDNEENDVEVEKARSEEEMRRREMKKWRKADEKERKRLAKEEMKLREEYENVRRHNNNDNYNRYQ